MEGREEKRQGDTRIPAALSPRQQVQRCAILPQAGSSTEEILRSLGEQLPGSRGKLPSGGWLAYVLGEGKLRTHICVSRNVVILHSVSKNLSPASSEAGEKNPLISASHFFFPHYNASPRPSDYILDQNHPSGCKAECQEGKITLCGVWHK